jgi:hypothetical protein
MSESNAPPAFEEPEVDLPGITIEIANMLGAVERGRGPEALLDKRRAIAAGPLQYLMETGRPELPAILLNDLRGGFNHVVEIKTAERASAFAGVIAKRGVDLPGDRKAAREDRAARVAAKKAHRARLEAELGARQRALPDKRYGVILADPPWRFQPYSRETGMDRAAENHYPTSTLAEIKALPVASIAAPDCVLLLWATVPMLPQALDVMAAWGFDYKSNLAWAKDRIGTGYWFRNRHEHLLVGTRGSVPAPGLERRSPR